MVAALPLTEENVAVLAASRARYRDGVEWLMRMGRIADAEMYCRIHRDPGLDARYAEERGARQSAARKYMEARDYEAALRCSLAVKDGRGAARAYERLGRVEEAIAIWKKLGSKRDVERLRKKYPLAKGGNP